MSASGHRGKVHVGCSGWSYPEWRGLVYPAELPAPRWLATYATRFDTVEINSTFYRLPAQTTVDRWAADAPPGFTFAVKVGQFGSHRKKLTDPATWLANHLDRVRRLGAHLGPNLVQLPPRWKRNANRLGEFLHACPPDIRWAVEFRDASWLHDDILNLLARHHAALCVHDLLPDHPWELTTTWTYVRFHGPDALSHPYRGSYPTSQLRHAAERLDHWRSSGVDIHAYFNNDHAARAVVDATRLRELLEPPRARRSNPPKRPPASRDTGDQTIPQPG
ncbi:MAG: DUF72 domain-containing protein [Acidimicrobiales bacterium]|jgi:uncharacterized protein YecE (DUF72 family)|nr:DUF72 domain-containing protein [Acidimicrobiales bacterium]